MASSPTSSSASHELVDALTVAVAVTRAADGTLLYANPQFETLLSTNVAGVVGRTIDEVFGESDVHRAIAAGAGGNAGAATEVEVRGVSPDGRPVWVLASAHSIPFDEEPEALLVAFRDASLRRQLEGEVARLAEFPEMNPGPVCRLNEDGAVALANAAARRLFGGEDVVGRKWRELCPGLDDDVWQRVLGSEAPTPIETQVGGVDVLFTYVCRDGGETVFAFGADISERRNAERRVEEQAAALLEVARFPDMNPGPVLRLDLAGTVLLANAAARDVLGLDPVGECWLDICPGLDQEMWQAVLSAAGPIPFEARVGDRDYVFHHRRDVAGELVFVFGADISQQKLAERALRQSERMATLGTLSAGVAHELNNPAAATTRAAEQLRDALARLEEARSRLDGASISPEATVVLRRLEHGAREAAAHPHDLDPLERSDREAALETWLTGLDIESAWELSPSLVAQGLTSSELASLADAVQGPALSAALAWVAEAFPVYALVYEIAEGSQRISEIVGALRGYSYLGQAPLQAIDLHEGLDNTLVILRSKLKQGVTVHREYCTDMPRVPAYGSELNQVWTNLLDNAADAMGGQGEIVIRTRSDDGWAVVEIEDDGPGIPEELQAQIFDPFFTTKEPGKGTGLGLATTYSIVTEKHGGTIVVESQSGRTQFTVRLPLDEQHSA